MKKYLIVLLAAILGVVSCSKEQKIVGSWELSKLVQNDVERDLSGMDLTMTLTFSESGKLVSTYSYKGFQASDEYTYAVEGDVLTIGSIAVDYTISGKTLTIIGNGNLLGMDGNIKVSFERI